MADVGPRGLIGLRGVGVLHCPAVSLGLDALFLVCPGTQHRQLLGVGNKAHVFKYLDGRNPVAG
jgi:hypothetical protein